MKLSAYRVLLPLLFVFVTGCDPDKSSDVNSPSVKNNNNKANQSAKLAKGIGEFEAIRLAEEFITENGYTDLPPMNDKSKLFYESLEGGSSPDEVLKYRKDSLERKAYGIIAAGNDGPAWTVVFRYKSDNAQYGKVIPDYQHFIREYGRAVTMEIDGSNIRVEHEDRSLKRVDKRTP